MLPEQSEKGKLGQWYATAICGNDITSSCLYVSALALLWAGPWAPVSLLLVGGVLYLFRSIYTEVVGALPLNGGAYNALLNTTSKFKASIAACLTILSYLATAVISASEAVHYADSAMQEVTGLDFSSTQLLWITIGLMGVFALLTYRGIGESAKVALCIFIFHITSLTVLLLLGGYWLFNNGLDILHQNLALPPPNPSKYPLLFGFAVSMLGISGFESSANFVEEQKQGVFPKTLRNMWIAVTFFNPMLCLLALCLVPLPEVAGHKEALLAHTGDIVGGGYFRLAVSIDAALVLCGALLTSFVGVTGLVHRMTLDRCLPQALLKKSRFKTFYRIIFAFFLLSSLLLYVAGNVEALAGVYTISFLCVMILFAFGNMFLKIYRNRLPRGKKASWPTLLLGIAALGIALGGNIILKTEYVGIFLLYFIPAVIIVAVMLERISILRVIVYIVRSISIYVLKRSQAVTKSLEHRINDINSQTVVFFTRGDDLAHLNSAMLYVRHNEHTNRILVVLVVKSEDDVPEKLKKDLEFLDEAYPEIHIEFVSHVGEFSPELVKELSDNWNIPLNFMFIGSPGNRFPHMLADFGGVRLII